MRAQEYFTNVRKTVIDIERSRETLERMKASEDAHVQRYEQGSSNGDTDALDRINMRIEFEARLESRIDEAKVIIAEATEVLYGQDNHGGLAREKGSLYADVVNMAYVQAMTWREVAEIMTRSVSWCRELSNRAFSYIDVVGMYHLRTIKGNTDEDNR